MPESTSRQGKQVRELTGRAVLVWFLGFFGVVFAVNAVMVRAAISTFGGLEVASSYQAGLNFTREEKAAHAQDALHWQVAAKLSAAADGETRLDVTAEDASGQPLRGLIATARLDHPEHRASDRVIALAKEGPGRFGGTTVQAIGQWDLVIELVRDGKRLFRSRNRIVLH